MTTSHEPAATAALRAFGQLLRRLRHAADLTQEQLAERALVSPRSISELERGSTHWPRVDTITLLADGLELTGAERAAFVGLARGRYAPDAAEAPAVRVRLPAPPTPIIGRDTEREAALAALRDPQVRLLTLVGPGGVGKTRLALDLAQHAASAFPDGVQFVDLAPLRDPAFLYDAIAQALDLALDPAIPLQRALTQALQERAMLLVLDNFEQIAPAAPAVASLLSGCPGLRLLVTSRLPLRLRAEHVYPVEPLTLPDPDAKPSLSELAATPAVALFINRAAAANPGFALTAQNARAVAGITQRLDGLPLAIELAANRIKVLSPTDLLERLGARLPLLTRGAHDLPARQQALRSTLAWSYDLLDPPAQRVFCHLSVFPGGCTLDAAESICDALNAGASAPLPATHALDLLMDLVEKSLVRTQPDLGDAMRFGMLETIREFGSDLLEASGELAQANQAHRAWCLHLAERAEPMLLSKEQEFWHARLGLEHDNLRAALSGALADHDHDLALRLCVALYRFWAHDGRYEEGRRWLERALDLAPPASTSPRGHALIGLGVMRYFQGNYEQAAAIWQGALGIFLEVGDVRGAAYAHGNLGLIADVTGDYPRTLAEYDAALVLFRQLEDQTYISFMTHNSGLVAYYQGDYPRARALFMESLELLEDDENSRALTLGNLSLVALAEGQTDHAYILQRDAFANWRRVTNLPWLGRGLEHFALIAIAGGDPEHGARLLGAAAAERTRLGGSQPDNDRAINERYIAQAQAALGEAAFALLWAEGETLPLPDAIALALR